MGESCRIIENIELILFAWCGPETTVPDNAIDLFDMQWIWIVANVVICVEDDRDDR